jgi:hypothetical protein
MVTARTWLQKTVYSVGTENVHHPTQNSQKKYTCRILQCSKKEGDAFLPRIITSDGTWVHHYNTKMKR